MRKVNYRLQPLQRQNLAIQLPDSWVRGDPRCKGRFDALPNVFFGVNSDAD